MEVKENPVKHQNRSQGDKPIAGLLDITYYTDPLCCWSWGFEPQWRKLLYAFKDVITYRYHMCGLLPGWKNYHDAVNSVSRPMQMGPVWMHAGQLSGMPVQQNIWMTDPPASSYPACIAVKCVELQSEQAAEIYLRLLREAIMINGQNIAQQEVLMKEAENLLRYFPGFDLKQFATDIKSETGLEAFRSDLKDASYRNINRYPSLIIRNEANRAIIISGHRPYPNLLEAIGQLIPLRKTDQPIDMEQYKKFWPFLTSRELEEIQ